MHKPSHEVADLLINHGLFDQPVVIKILIVIDGSVTFEPGWDTSVTRFVRLLRESKVDCTRFHVDIADRRRSRMTDDFGDDPKFKDFKFDQENESGNRVINGYDQLWLFGSERESGSIGHTEIVAVFEFMNAGGGVFATGDHQNLGAAMGTNVPRVRKMRRWTEVDNAPDIINPPSEAWGKQINTLRPRSRSAGRYYAAESAEFYDSIPQPIEWVHWQTAPGFRFRSQQARPHPVLCHPTYGPIDVMPDHIHEGRVRDISEIDLTYDVMVDETNLGPEFPHATDGTQPKPSVIAYGQTLRDAPRYYDIRGPRDIFTRMRLEYRVCVSR